MNVGRRSKSSAAAALAPQGTATVPASPERVRSGRPQPQAYARVEPSEKVAARTEADRGTRGGAAIDATECLGDDDGPTDALQKLTPKPAR